MDKVESDDFVQLKPEIEAIESKISQYSKELELEVPKFTDGMPWRVDHQLKKLSLQRLDSLRGDRLTRLAKLRQKESTLCSCLSMETFQFKKKKPVPGEEDLIELNKHVTMLELEKEKRSKTYSIYCTEMKRIRGVIGILENELNESDQHDNQPLLSLTRLTAMEGLLKAAVSNPSMLHMPPARMVAGSSEFEQVLPLHQAVKMPVTATTLPKTQGSSSQKTGVVPWQIPHRKANENLYKKIRAILNKLAPQNFLTLLEQMKELPINTEERLQGVIDLVFERAVDEPIFSVPYANMCKHLAMKAVPTDQNNQNVNFRKLLLTKCQKEFESDARDKIRRVKKLRKISTAYPDKRKQLTEELEDKLRESRRRSLGNIKFIGELYKLNMLVTPIMHDCLKKLLKAEDEDSLECLCRLLTTVGKELETDKKSDQSEKRAQNKAMMDSYFEGMKKVVDNRHTSSRVRFMIQDVIELRLNNWIPRKQQNNWIHRHIKNTPKTIDQIHIEAEQEAHEQHLMVQQSLPYNRIRRKNRSLQGGFEEGIGGNKSRDLAFNCGPSEGTIKLVSKKLEFTMQGGRAAPPESFSMEEIKKGLDNLLKRNSTNEEIFDWIEAKLDRDSLVLPSFIHALVTAVTESSIEEGIPYKSWHTKKIIDRAVILTRFIDGNDQLELQVLYALQALDYRLQHPKGMLLRIFDALFDEDIISEDTFGQWEKSEDPAEKEGRGVVLKSVQSFLKLLQEEDENLS